MGALFSCFSQQQEGVRKRPPRQRRRSAPANLSAADVESAVASVIGSSNRWNKIRSNGKKDEEVEDEAMIQEQALAFLLQHSGGGGGGPLQFDRSSSVRHPNSSSAQKKHQALPRSSSTRPRSLTDPLVQPQQLVNQDVKIDDLETSHFLLVHGGGFGAWCWYKTIALLEEGGLKVNAIDLAGSGVHSFNTNNIASLSQYVKPLTDFLEKLGDGEKVNKSIETDFASNHTHSDGDIVYYRKRRKNKVIVVGHDFGGACISYAMEMYPSKIAKAVFVSATMLASGQSTLDMFSQQAGTTDDLMQQAQVFMYANGNDHPPTAIDLDKSLLKELLFNQSPTKDIALASVSMRPIPFAPVLEKLSLSDRNYGSVRRFFIETSDDNAIPLSLQQSMCNSNPPEQVFRLKGSDHSPFFSKPQALHRLLIEISKIPSTEVKGSHA